MCAIRQLFSARPAAVSLVVRLAAFDAHYNETLIDRFAPAYYDY